MPIETGVFGGGGNSKQLHYVTPKIKQANLAIILPKTDNSDKQIFHATAISGTLKNAYTRMNVGGAYGDKLEIHIILEDDENIYNFSVAVSTSWFNGKFSRCLFSAKKGDFIKIAIAPIRDKKDASYGMVLDADGKILPEKFTKEELPKWEPLLNKQGKQALNEMGLPAYDKSEQLDFIAAKLQEWLEQFPKQEERKEPSLAQKIADIQSNNTWQSQWRGADTYPSSPATTQEEPEDLPF